MAHARPLRSLFLAGLCSAVLLLLACAGTEVGNPRAAGGHNQGPGGSGAGGSGSGGAGGGGGGQAGAGGGPGGSGGAGGGGGSGGQPGSIPLVLEADLGSVSDEVVSVAVPFPPRLVGDAGEVRLLDAGGVEVPSTATTLATWPADGSARSVLLAFRATLGQGESARYAVEHGVQRNAEADGLAANPDGPVAALLPPAWYAGSQVIGEQLPAAANGAFAGYEPAIEAELAGMDPAWDSYGLSCDRTSAERTYYDGPHALFIRHVRLGTAASYRRAREEARWYRDHELSWYAGDSVALYSCAPAWDPATPLRWGDMRRMLGQGMLDDYLLSGDPAARAAVAGLGEAFRQNLPALTSGNEITVRVTERNLAWPLLGLASYYAVSPTADVRAAVDGLVDVAVAWQAEGTSGAFEHDLVRPDPDECGDGPRGASPFMTSLLVDGLVEAHRLTGDAEVPGVVIRSATWFRDHARTADGRGFQYLWGCNDTDYSDGPADLNLLIAHVFGAAYTFSRDPAWLDFGDTVAGAGVEDLYVGAPKQWSQANRGFPRYLGHRAAGRTP